MRIAIGITAMVLLFTSFIIAFVTHQRKKLEYQKNLRAMLEQRQEMLARQNEVLETMVQERTAELSEQKAALQESITELRNTQQQLIQSEKMASLGEITAGIAHEIQNPLNFINNFSEVSVELFEELEEELKNGHTDNALEVSADLRSNLERILQHGERADKIVKSMLEHSRIGSGKKENVYLNELAEEALKLSLHSFRAKNQFIHVATGFEGAPNLPDLYLIPQDISRVLVNICNNALYAVSQRLKNEDQEKYEPFVLVKTVFDGTYACVVIEDNGTGIPEKNIHKIFQPFFTTKPTGEGTGLGLSLSYDIIAKVHGGRIEVISQEGKGTAFTVCLPITHRL